MSEMTPERLDAIEARAKYAAALEHTILGSYIERHDWPSTDDDKIVIHRSTVMWLVAALREAWAENEQLRGIIEGLEDANAGRVKTFNTIDEMLNELNASAASSPDRSAASDEATGGGG